MRLHPFWPVSCMLIWGTACTFGPIEYVPVNLEPHVKNAVPAPDAAEVVLPEGGKTLYVVVGDDDLDWVRYTWELSDSGRLGEGTTEGRVYDRDDYPVEEANVFYLEDDPLYDGQTLKWTMSDFDTGIGDDLRDFSLTFTWTVVVP